MPKFRQHNVSAARWSANGGSLGAVDLTEESSYPFGANVFSLKAQRERLPEDVCDRLQGTLEKGAALDTALADEVARGMKEWALEKGATHYTHVFQPLTGLTAEKHDSFFGPSGDGTAAALLTLESLGGAGLGLQHQGGEVVLGPAVVPVGRAVESTGRPTQWSA